ncbi:ImmA/IrrE family metallo-endopeptidase [Salicibibacter cibarius]|uniref:ImmA/IrrE family metallo-endopeptidase n=1 Tax=Salicibibacter cibarius TaxID=2743000 RepID=A0A7T6Z7A9_9BACI|nr:ImmA/IrrE family metallo-endopeptidase [Salicibibacter cibarius]QQK78204.1 ImmA/IrrE family metallo-endopeptidase [Salicibibacter cibarius]
MLYEQRCAHSLIKKHRTDNPFKIAEQKHIVILYEELGSTLGYFHTSRRIRFIHINNKLNESMQRFVCAHELGHSVLHPDVNTPFLKKNTFFSMDKIETEANAFAAKLLLQDDIIYNYQDTNMTIQELGSIYGVPEEVTHLKRISD